MSLNNGIFTESNLSVAHAVTVGQEQLKVAEHYSQLLGQLKSEGI